MVCFEVSINGAKLATGGIPGFAVLTAIITWVHRKGEAAGRTDVTLTGMDSNEEPGEHLRWKHAEVEPGDEILVRIVEDAAIDPPGEKKPSRKSTTADRIRNLRRELQYVEQRRIEIKQQIVRLEAKEGDVRAPERTATTARKAHPKPAVRKKK